MSSIPTEQSSTGSKQQETPSWEVSICNKVCRFVLPYRSETVLALCKVGHGGADHGDTLCKYKILDRQCTVHDM